MTNTTDKYITIPASELSGRELRAHPNGKKVANPDYIEPAAEREAREYRAKLLAIHGANYWTKGDKTRIYFNDIDVDHRNSFFNGFYDCNTGEFDGNCADKEQGRELVEAFRNKYGV